MTESGDLLDEEVPDLSDEEENPLVREKRSGFHAA